MNIGLASSILPTIFHYFYFYPFAFCSTSYQCCGSEIIYSGSGSRQKLRIHADLAPTCINWVSIIQNNPKHPLNSIKKKNLTNYLPFSIQYYCPIVETVLLYALSLFAGSGSSQKFRIHADPDPDPQHLDTVPIKNGPDPWLLRFKYFMRSERSAYPGKHVWEHVLLK